VPRAPAPGEGAILHFARLAAQALRSPVALLYAGSPDEPRVASFGAPAAWKPGWEAALAERLLRRMAATDTLATPQLRAGPRFPGAGGCAAVRVGAPGTAPALLAVLDTRPRAWDEAEMELLGEVAAAAAAALGAAGNGEADGPASPPRWRYHWLAGRAGGSVLLPGAPAGGTSAIPPWDEAPAAPAAAEDGQAAAAGLRVRYAAAAAALEGATVEDAFRQALAGVCEHAGWPAGRALLRGAPGSVPDEVWHLAGGGTPASAPRPPLDGGLVERARRTGEPAWAREAEAALPALLWALGARGALALPVYAGGEVAAVLELFPAEPHPPEPWLADALEDAAAHLGRRLEREARDEALRRDSEHSRALVERAGAIVWEADPATLRYLFVSSGAERLLGWPAERWTGDPEFRARYLHPADREWVVAQCRDAAACGEPHDLEYRMVAADGRTVWVRDIVGPRQDGRIVGVMVDATDRRAADRDREHLLVAEQEARARAERAERRSTVLAYSSELLHSAFDDSREDLRATLSSLATLAVPTLADYCRIDELGADGSLARLALVHGGGREEEAGADAFAPGAPAARHPALHVARTGETVFLPETGRAELRALFADPAELRALPTRLRSLLVVPLAARGRVFGALTLATAGSRRRYERDDLHFAEDLARRIALALDNVRLYRDAEAAARLRDDVVAIVSHDLRNPLGVVTFSSDVLLRSWDGNPGRARDRRHLEGIAQAAERMRRLIMDLLDVARVDAGSLPVEPVPCPAGPLAAHALELDAALAEERGVTVRSLVPDDAPLVLADRERILQVISNLLGNAVRFTPPGGAITLRAHACEREVRFALADAGPGIPPDDLPHVFDRFWRGQRSARSGAGLGLAIARGIVEAHGGRIWAESVLGEGSTFYFTLPRADAGR
jgi:PAS domain S-box-containing protein